MANQNAGDLPLTFRDRIWPVEREEMTATADGDHSRSRYQPVVAFPFASR
jgi:hypothetical protein